MRRGGKVTEGASLVKAKRFGDHINIYTFSVFSSYSVFFCPFRCFSFTLVPWGSLPFSVSLSQTRADSSLLCFLLWRPLLFSNLVSRCLHFLSITHSSVFALFCATLLRCSHYGQRGNKGRHEQEEAATHENGRERGFCMVTAESLCDVSVVSWPVAAGLLGWNVFLYPCLTFTTEVYWPLSAL